MIVSTEQFVSRPARRSGPRGAKSHLSPVQVAVHDANRRAISGEWDTAKGATFVGLYAMCHQMVYGVLPAELDPPGIFRQAAKAAAQAMHQMFDDDPYEVVKFLRWTWEREKRRNSYSQKSGHERSRLMWRWQFSRAVYTDYLVAKRSR